jgi:hypothetical protein
MCFPCVDRVEEGEDGERWEEHASSFCILLVLLDRTKWCLLDSSQISVVLFLSYTQSSALTKCNLFL